VPDGVIDRLEPVDVDVRDDEALAAALRAIHLALDGAETDAAQQRSGEIVDALGSQLLRRDAAVVGRMGAVLGGGFAVVCRGLALQRGPAAAQPGPAAVANPAQRVRPSGDVWASVVSSRSSRARSASSFAASSSRADAA
jgi:hypothetical protein